MYKYKYGLRGHDIADNFSDMCKKAKEYKIDVLQFALAKTCKNINFDEIGYKKDLSINIREQLLRNQLNVAVLGCYINPVDCNELSRKNQINRFKNFLHYAKDFDADVIGTETGCVETIEETHSNENYINFLNNMITIFEKAEELGVYVGIEPVWQFTIFSVEKMKEMIDDIQSKKIAVILDVSNIINSQNYLEQRYIISKAFDVLGEHIKTIHLKDFDFINGEKVFVPAGNGRLNIELIYKNIEQMQNKPKIILDELPLSKYKETVEKLNSRF